MEDTERLRRAGVCGIFATTGPQFDDCRLFGMLAFAKVGRNITISISAG